MSEKSLPAPTNTLVTTVNQLVDFLVEGLGADAAIVLGETQQPWLKAPIINWIFKKGVHTVADALNDSLTKKIDKVIIRYQGKKILEKYEEALSKIKPGVTDADLQAAKDSIDSIVNRNR